MSKIIIDVIGILGVGKSTFCEHLHKLISHATLIHEPVDKWLQIKDKNTGMSLLDTFYNDKKRWTYTFENIAFITRLDALMNVIDDPNISVIIMDGSLVTDKNVYAQTLHDTGFMNSLEWECYNIWNNFYEKHVKQHKVYYVYLHCDPNIIMERVKNRGRQGEKNLDIEYFIGLQKGHDDWLIKDKISNVLTFDFSCSENSEDYNNILKQVVSLVE